MSSSLLAPTRTPVAVRRTVRRDADITRMTRYRGGTYSPTVDTVVFTDGTTARTDLIRLNPNIDAYSVDFQGIAPTRPSHYRPANWSAVPNEAARAVEAEVDWIIRNSFPTLGTVELSRRVRAAGYLAGDAHLAEHEAIAATQAAIWHFTNGLRLDNRPLNVPVAVTAEPGAITYEFDGEPQLGSYTVELVSDAAVSLALQKSADGAQWRDVAASSLNVGAGFGRHRRTLGVGATASDSRPGQQHRGYRFYRLLVLADPDAVVDIDEVTFTLNGSGNYRNAERVVALYNYLVAGAETARRLTVVPRLITDRAVTAAVIGPLRFEATDAATLTAVGGTLIDAAGEPITAPVVPGTDIYLRPAPQARRVTITASVPAAQNGFGGRVITGVAHDSSLTPVALAVPTPTVIDFELTF
ncbi:TQXA domain-containing protein [Mycobacterium sp. CBMA293]|uniref:thioester domain-containing protein n=1 Tax=unclassified Mycolicibacterium TaxID=2636767 RepID=UPI0012DC6DA7|nr:MULTISPECIES: thioester domain-containing protein [unclassified Mycolicibacterium]MUL45738.1 TQXA domain-containing protein [Mycolicibacterium sp. CBMA 360]MUL60409.1 TQXA domain-containing protein [Mycolicibacterium sp. CBMA 335]MUL71379.1 TQXA domain-containing protein [Mycolicibacterium sp. CBMA 311]MUL73196.1 TQXA domain-containing protein [Mycolicibacterium sp. CBMA 311]MUL96995.1 TQXA domain-containing protein [Mycolicibacterium sp. CBMA 230]